MPAGANCGGGCVSDADCTPDADCVDTCCIHRGPDPQRSTNR